MINTYKFNALYINNATGSTVCVECKTNQHDAATILWENTSHRCDTCGTTVTAVHGGHTIDPVSHQVISYGDECYTVESLGLYFTEINTLVEFLTDAGWTIDEINQAREDESIYFTTYA